MKHFRSRYVLAGIVCLVASGAAVLTTTVAEAATGCRVSYAVSSQWPGGFGANVTITNLGDPVTNWRLTWSFGAGQTVTQLWNGSVIQSGAQVTVTNASYNGAIATGGSTAFGFNGAWNGSNPVPTDFALNGTACTGAGPTTAGPTTAGPTTAGPTTAGPTTAGPTTAGPTTAGPTTAGPTTAGPTTAGPTTAGPTTAAPCSRAPGGSGGGSGPYPAGYETSSSLSNHTIYRPESLPCEKLPIFVWGNGGCSNNGTAPCTSSGRSRRTGSWQSPTAARTAPATETPRCSRSRSTGRSRRTPARPASTTAASTPRRSPWRVVLRWAGGVRGLQRLARHHNVIFSSGLLNDADDYQLRRLTKPIAYFIGGSSDIAYPNAMDDWGKLPSGLPALMGNLPVGHGGTYDPDQRRRVRPRGGAVPEVAPQGRPDRRGELRRVELRPVSGTQWQVQQKNLTL